MKYSGHKRAVYSTPHAMTEGMAVDDKIRKVHAETMRFLHTQFRPSRVGAFFQTKASQRAQYADKVKHRLMQYMQEGSKVYRSKAPVTLKQFRKLCSLISDNEKINKRLLRFIAKVECRLETVLSLQGQGCDYNDIAKPLQSAVQKREFDPKTQGLEAKKDKVKDAGFEPLLQDKAANMHTYHQHSFCFFKESGTPTSEKGYDNSPAMGG